MLVLGQAWWSHRPASIPLLELVGPVEGLHPITEAILLHGVWHVRLVARALKPLTRTSGTAQAGELATLHRRIEHHLARATDRQVEQSERLTEVELAAAAATDAITLLQQASLRVQRTLERLSRRLKVAGSVIASGRRTGQSFWSVREYGDDRGGPQIALETARVAALTAIDWLWLWNNEILAEASALRNHVARSRGAAASDAAQTLVSVLKRIRELTASASMPDQRRGQRDGLDQCVKFVIGWLHAPRSRSLPRSDEGPPHKARLIKSSVRGFRK